MRTPRPIESEQEEGKIRSINLPSKVWAALDGDAKRCRRSSQKQLEALLIYLYDLEDIAIDKGKLATAAEKTRGGEARKAS